MNARQYMQFRLVDINALNENARFTGEVSRAL